MITWSNNIVTTLLLYVITELWSTLQHCICPAKPGFRQCYCIFLQLYFFEVEYITLWLVYSSRSIAVLNHLLITFPIFYTVANQLEGYWHWSLVLEKIQKQPPQRHESSLTDFLNCSLQLLMVKTSAMPIGFIYNNPKVWFRTTSVQFNHSSARSFSKIVKVAVSIWTLVWDILTILMHCITLLTTYKYPSPIYLLLPPFVSSPDAAERRYIKLQMADVKISL